MHLVASPENLGFTGGNNLALHTLGFPVAAPLPAGMTAGPLSTPDMVLLLNPDTEVVDDALWQLAAALAADASAGACGANLRYGDGRFQHGAFAFPTLAQVLIDFYPLAGVPGMHRLHDSRLNGRYPRRIGLGRRPSQSTLCWVRRCWCAATRFGVSAGWTVPISCTVKRWTGACGSRTAGYRVLAVPTAQVIHHAGQSSRQVRWTAFERLWRSRFRFYAQHAAHYGPGSRAAIRVAVRTALAGRRRAAQRRFAQGKIDGAALAEELAAYDAVARL